MSAVLAIGGKHFGSFRHRDDVFVARYRPKSTAVVFGIPSDGRFAPESLEDLMWDAIAVEIRILEVDEGGFHQYSFRPLDLRQKSFFGVSICRSVLGRPASQLQGGIPGECLSCNPKAQLRRFIPPIYEERDEF